MNFIHLVAVSGVVLFAVSTSFADFQEGDLALYNSNGKYRAVRVTEDSEEGGAVPISWREQTNMPGSTRSFVELKKSVSTQSLISSTDTIPFDSAKKWLLKKGLAVKGQNDVVYFVEQVFRDGRLLLNRMEPGIMSDLGQTGFVVTGPAEVVTKDFVKAVEVPCSSSSSVCVGDKVTFKNGVKREVCITGQDYRLVSHEGPPFTAKYTKSCEVDSARARVNKVFSDDSVTTSSFSGVWRQASDFTKAAQKSSGPGTSKGPAKVKAVK